MMLDKYVLKGGKKLRYGYTTGSCATAAAKAAALMLVNQKEVKKVIIDTPKGWMLELEVHDIEFNKEYARCSIIKDSGDDPDVTNGIKVCATVKFNNEFKIVGGVGVGVITKKGLSIPVGEAAINPVPRETIKTAISKVTTLYNFLVEISVPKGEEIALRTFNPNLGIKGGISIIGTSGIVEPMSEEALKQSIALELSMLSAEGHEDLILVPGNYGQEFATSIGLPKSNIVKTSNFIGYILDKALELKFKRILMVGHLGKLVKVAGGIFQTHSKYADARMEVLASYSAASGASQQLVKEILNCITTDEAIGKLKKAKLQNVFNIIAERVSFRASKRTYNTVQVESIVFSREYGELGRSEQATKYLEEYINAKS